MRRREASDDEEEEERERPLRRIDSRAAIGSDGESDGQGAAAEYDDEESEIEEEELEVEEEEEEEEVEADVVEEGEHEVRGGKDSVEIGGEDEKELDGDGRRSVGESMELFQGVNQVEEEKKENEPFAVPTAGAFYMHDDMFRDSAGGGRHRNGIQQRKNSWQDGVSGTNCPIRPGMNWTYVFQTKDQIGTFFYFPSLNFHKAGGGFGPIRVNNRAVIAEPFPKPEAEFDLLIGDWYQHNFKDVRSKLNTTVWAYHMPPDGMLMNGKGPYLDPFTKAHESFTVTQGKTYRFRIANVGIAWSINFRIQNHQMVVVETEGSYTNQITLDSLDVHVGQSYSVLVTANQEAADYYIVASPKLSNATDNSSLVGRAVLHYDNSTTTPNGPLPKGPDPFDLDFSLNQAKSIRWNLTAGAARPNPQGTFNVSNVTLSQTFILQGSTININGVPRYTLNNVSYTTPDTPLKLADNFINGSDVYNLDEFPVNSSNPVAVDGTFVATGNHKGWLEIVFKNDLNVMDSWHLDGFGFYVVGFGHGKWTPELRSTYNLYDPVVRSTAQVYPGRWTAVYAYLDNPGMWNLRSQHLKNWYLGQELYVRVYDADPDPAKERPPPENLLFCGKVDPPPPPPPSPPPPPTPNPIPAPPPQTSSALAPKIAGARLVMVICTVLILQIGLNNYD